ncbi:hypothetical protein J1N35_040532 [Gossypium stocksii]|uniref:Uncharacterized protein n=1 Tax=Gossypium stocksii TaxID=47602 RepID=A0A9D3ZIX1_9ROSI|nr:hypothetical protein J1N35_040532 [Gossypium stocksii]
MPSKGGGYLDDVRTSNDYGKGLSTRNECLSQCQTRLSTTRAHRPPIHEPAMPPHSSTDANGNLSPSPDLPDKNIRPSQNGQRNRMLISDCNISLGFLDPDNIQINSYHTTLLDIPKQIDLYTLDMLNIRDAIMCYFDAIGWSSFANISCNAYYELIYEFYTTFSFNINALRTVEMQDVCFRLLGKDFRMSISDFNISMGFVDPDNIQTDSYHTALLDIPSNFDA